MIIISESGEHINHFVHEFFETLIGLKFDFVENSIHRLNEMVTIEYFMGGYLHIGMFMLVLISGHAYLDCRRRVKAIFKSR